MQMYNLTMYHGGLIDQLMQFVLVLIGLFLTRKFGNKFDRNRKMTGTYAHTISMHYGL